MKPFAIIYRIYGENRSRFVQIEAVSDQGAVGELIRKAGTHHLVVLSIRPAH